MSDLCLPEFAELASQMGFSCDEAGGIASLNNPFGLNNWTMPVLEVLIIAGSVLALIYAIIRLRRHRDPTPLVLWIGALFFLFIIEPPIYFPDAFGTEEYLGTMFAHNLFTVEFLWGRLPLYIVAIYPLMATMSFELVRSLGVFRRYGIWAGACAVGFIHHALYEIFDQLGPQLRWWEWSADNEIAKPFLNGVPIPSIVVFAALWPMSLALCVQWLVGREVDRGRLFGGGQLVWRTVVIGLLASVGVLLLPMPATIIGWGSNEVRSGVYVVELIIISIVAIYVLVAQTMRLRGIGTLVVSADAPEAVRYDSPFARHFTGVYLAVMAFLWAVSMPEYLDAEDGITGHGVPIGNVWYTTACFMVAISVVWAAWAARRTLPPNFQGAPLDVPARAPADAAPKAESLA